jgi:molybdate transport system permease protein
MDSVPRKARSQGFSPVAIKALAAVAILFFLLPLIGLALQAPWSELWDQIRQPEVLDSLKLSVIVSLAALALALIFGAPLAWVLAYASFPGRRLVRALTLLPMVLPPVVAGVGLLVALGRQGILGGFLSQLGISLPFTTPAAAVAAAFVGAPFLVVTLEAGFRSVDRGLEDAASTLGASRWMIIRTVTLPAVRPALVAGATLCWARALGEFGATIIFAGNLRGVTQTSPLAVYEELQTGDPGGAILLSLVLLLMSLTVLFVLRGRVDVR